jgi:hypothetical protein
MGITILLQRGIAIFEIIDNILKNKKKLFFFNFFKLNLKKNKIRI